MEDFDSLNEKQLESLERGLSDLKHNRVMTSDEFWKGLLSNKEQQLLIDEAYKNYCKSFENQTLIEEYSFDTDPMTQFMFINKCKTDSEFSEKWGLKIEERELTTVRERKKYDRYFDNLIGERSEHHITLDRRGVPRKIINISYNNKKIESYE